MSPRRVPSFAILLLVFALIASACGSDPEFASEASVTVDESGTDESHTEESDTETEAPEEVVEDAADDAVDEPVEEEVEASPQPVTASTIPETTSDDFPDILAATATPTGDNTWRFDVTVSSTYDTPDRYADAWRVVGPDGTEYGIRVLGHDHAGEQPFTRSQTGIVIPPEVTTVTIEGRDLANGWGGGFLVVNLAGE